MLQHCVHAMWSNSRRNADQEEQEAQLSPRDRAMRRVDWNLANCHATVQKLLIRQVLTKSMVWSWRFSRRQCVIDNVHSTMSRPSRFHCLRCVINKPTTDDLWISPVYRRLAVAKFSKSTNWKLLTWLWPRPLITHHKTKTSHGRPMNKIWSL